MYLANPNYRGIIFRRTYPRLTEIVDRSHRWFTRIEPPQPNYSNKERAWVWPNGVKLRFAHCQHEESKYDYQGHEYQYMGFDQLEEFTESQYEFLKVQARTSDDKLRVRIRATANPGNVGHLWVKRKFIDNKESMKIYWDEHSLSSMFIPAKVYDNPSLMDNDPMYIKRLEALPEEERKALLYGDWNVFVGQYFKEWNESVHLIEPFYIPDYWKRFIAGDYGFKKPSSVGWYAKSPEGEVVRYKEIYREGLHYDSLASLICDYSKDEDIEYAVFDPAIFGDRQHHKEAREGRSGAEIMQEIVREKRGERSFTIMRADNRRIEGWRNLKQRLKNESFKVFNTCVHFKTTFPANIYDDKKPEDLNTDGEDHSADEARYGLMSRPPETSLDSIKIVGGISPMSKVEELKRRREQYRH